MTNTAQHTPGPWLPGIKDGDVEPVIAGGVPIAEMIPTHCTEEEFEANCSLVYAAPDMHEALWCPALEEAHDTLSELLEDPDAGNDDIRDAALVMCDALNAFWVRRDAVLANTRGGVLAAKPTCADRAAWAEEAVTAYAHAKEGRADDPVAEMASDLFADLCHLCVREGLSPEQMMERARRHCQEACLEEGIVR